MTELAATVDVTCRFGTNVAVDCVSLAVRPGEIVGLIGANGAGKTTLIRMLLGLLAPSAGRVELFGAPPDRRSRRRLGYVAQGLGLYPDLTVAENAEFVAAAFGAPPADLPEDLAVVADDLVGSIGLGRQRRLAFATALAHTPELLVLDEPTSGVNPLARARLWDQIHEQAEGGTGVLVTTHYLQEAQQCDRLVLMAAGRAVVRGTLEEILAGRTATIVAAASWSEAFAALRAADLPVTLAGTRVRVADRPPDAVRRVLDAAGVAADVDAVPATLEEVVTLVGHDAA